MYHCQGASDRLRTKDDLEHTPFFLVLLSPLEVSVTGLIAETSGEGVPCNTSEHIQCKASSGKRAPNSIQVHQTGRKMHGTGRH